MSWNVSKNEEWYSNDQDQWIGLVDIDCGILFNFTPSGYTPPKFTKVNFNFITEYIHVMSLNASIQPSPTYKDTTYTYTKSRTVYGLGYCMGGGFQILKLLEYGGIRDLGAYILAKSPFTSSFKDLRALIFPYKFSQETVDLQAFLKVLGTDFADLGATIRAWHITDLRALISSVFQSDLSASIGAISPIDLKAKLRIYFEKNLIAKLHGWDYLNLGVYISSGFRDHLDLKALMGIYVPFDLKARLKSWALRVISNLPAYLHAYRFLDLGARIFVYWIKDLPGFLYAVLPFDLRSLIHGWDLLNLKATLVGGYGPGDLHARIFGIAGINLMASICARNVHGINLPASLRVWSVLNLKGLISCVGGSVGLPAIIEADGGLNLRALIAPRMVKIAKLLRVHTMNTFDLTAVVNMAPCFNFELRDLSAYLKARYLKDLTATIYGFRNIINQRLDLGAKIYTELMTDKFAFDDINIRFGKTYPAISLNWFNARFWDKKLTFDEITIRFRALGYLHSPYDLQASIFGEFSHSNLNATIQAVFDVFKYLDILENSFYAPYLINNLEIWKKLVELKFYSKVYKYYYDSFSSLIWKDDIHDKWVLDITALSEINQFFDFRRKKTKFVFSLEKFSSVDEAIRYAIDWVLVEPSSDLIAKLNASGGFFNLTARLNSGLITFKDFYNLTSSITAFVPKDLKAYLNSVVEWKDLTASISA